VISGPDRLVITLTDTQRKLGDLFVHLARVDLGVLRIGIPVVAAVEHARRSAIGAHPLGDAFAA
jgi:alanyl-tRNA synthetase